MQWGTPPVMQQRHLTKITGLIGLIDGARNILEFDEKGKLKHIVK